MRKRAVPNTLTALAETFGVREIGPLADELARCGLREKTAHALWKGVVAGGIPDDVDALVARGFSLNDDVEPHLLRSPLHLAARLGRAKIVAHLIDRHNMDPNLRLRHPLPDRGDRGPCPLYEACRGGRLQTVRLLLASGANPNMERPTDDGALQGLLAGWFRWNNAGNVVLTTRGSTPEALNRLAHRLAPANAKALALLKTLVDGGLTLTAGTPALDELLTRTVAHQADGVLAFLEQRETLWAGPGDPDGRQMLEHMATAAENVHANPLLSEALRRRHERWLHGRRAQALAKALDESPARLHRVRM